MTRINCQKVSKNISHTIEEWSELLGRNKKTIRRWIDIGLKIVDGGRNPILISGSDLKEFLGDKDLKKRKIKLKRNEFNCLHCKVARRAKRGSNKELSNRKIGLCSVCNSKMCRIFKPKLKDYKILSPPTQMSMFDY
jgi:hypothetical protein